MHALVCQEVGGTKYKTMASILALIDALILGLDCANFRTLRMMPHRMKRSTKISAFEILIMANFKRAIAHMELWRDRATALHEY